MMEGLKESYPMKDVPDVGMAMLVWPIVVVGLWFMWPALSEHWPEEEEG